MQLYVVAMTSEWIRYWQKEDRKGQGNGTIDERPAVFLSSYKEDKKTMKPEIQIRDYGPKNETTISIGCIATMSGSGKESVLH